MGGSPWVSEVEEFEVFSSRYSITGVKLLCKGSAIEIHMQWSVHPVEGPPNP